jgi:hypothetical protein
LVKITWTTGRFTLWLVKITWNTGRFTLWLVKITWNTGRFTLVTVKYMTYNTNRTTDIKSHLEYKKYIFNKKFNI